MDIKPQTTQPISDDQDLAKVLAGVGDDAAAQVDTTVQALPPLPDLPPETPPAESSTTQAATASAPAPVSTPAPAGSPGDDTLDGVKQAAISELRPLVDKLNISPEEKFDTYLLLIRSTDDKTLIAPAHQAARDISDEGRRAQALLDIIKEIDFLSNPQ